MNFFNRTTRWVLAPLADRLELPDQDCTPLSSNNPLLRRILAGVEQLLQERRTLKDQAHALSMDVARLTEQLAERDSHWHQAHAHWALISQGAGEWFWTLELDAATTPAPECAMHWTGPASLQVQGVDQLGRWSERLHPADQQLHLEALTRHLADRSGRTPFTLDARMKPTADGDYRWCRIRGVSRRDEQGVALAIGGSVRDIHEQYLHNQQLELAATRFDISREMLHDGLWDIEVVAGDPANPKTPSGGRRKCVGYWGATRSRSFPTPWKAGPHACIPTIAHGPSVPLSPTLTIAAARHRSMWPID